MTNPLDESAKAATPMGGDHAGRRIALLRTGERLPVGLDGRGRPVPDVAPGDAYRRTHAKERRPDGRNQRNV